MKKILVISSFLLCAAFNSAFSQAKNEPAKPAVELSNKAGWHKIDTTAVELSVDKDAVAVFGMDKFKALRVKAMDHGVEIKNMKVTYENGEVSTVDVNSTLKAGESSKDFSIDGSKSIKKVSYVYVALPNAKNEKARLELYGMK